jgi:hypothetical protein
VSIHGAPARRQRPAPGSDRISKRLELFDGISNGLAGCNQIGDQSLIGGDITFVLAAVADIVASSQDAPYIGAESKRVWKDLKDDITVRRPIA